MSKRAPKLTIERKERILEMMRAGNFMTTAAAAAGIHYNTLRKWVELGRDKYDEAGNIVESGNPKYREFAQAYEQATAEGEVALVAMVKDGGWKGAAWLLERRHADRYRLKTAVEMSGPGGKPIEALPPTIVVAVEGKVMHPFTFEAGAEDADPDDDEG